MFLHNNTKKKIYFSKMHGLGNDFIVINCIKKKLFLSPEIIKKMSDRYTGIGFDQLLFVEKPNNQNFDFHYRIFNANGNEVEQCGNGARCFGLFVILKGLTKKNRIFVSTKAKNLIITYLKKNIIQVNMGCPDFSINETLSLNKNNDHTFNVNLSKMFLNQYLKCNIVSMGNPHCIIQVQSIKNSPVKKISSNLTKNAIFPNGVNVSFMEIISKQYIKLRVYERDVGETQSCGSAACAAVASGIMRNLLFQEVQVKLLGGILTVKWKGVGHPLYMIGAAEYVYDGYIYI